MTVSLGVEETEAAGLAFAAEHGFVLIERLGFGQDGTVYRTSEETAVKVFSEERLSVAEWEAYLQIEEAGVESVAGHAIPRLLRTDFGRWILPLDLVFPPFVLDFARVSLNERSETKWPPDVWAERMASWENRFSAAQWPVVLDVRETLGATTGVWLEDLHAGNIRFVESDDEAAFGSDSSS